MQSRIQNIIDYFNLSMLSFSKELGVNRSTISHILSGRNKPSIDVLQKILKRYSSISPEWLLLGNGPMLKNNLNNLNSNLKLEDKTKEISKILVFYSNNTFKEYQEI